MPALWIETFPACAPDLAPPDGAGTLPCGTAIASTDPMVLTDIHRPGVNLTVLHRPLPDGLTRAALRDVLRAAPFTLTATGSVDAVSDQIARESPVALPDPLRLDLADLATLFAVIDHRRRRVRVRLEALTHDGCWKWHADSIGLRLLCTYAGAGTEWLGLPGGAATARAMTAPPPRRAVQRIPTGAIAILKGERHPDNAGNGCIHRSPPAGPGPRARLLLCIDQPEWNLEE